MKDYQQISEDIKRGDVLKFSEDESNIKYVYNLTYSLSEDFRETSKVSFGLFLQAIYGTNEHHNVFKDKHLEKMKSFFPEYNFYNILY
ncbi:MAG: hypothetical protein LIP03_15445 [Bacteroidales bacterium]|nr:hypothetical protein [Bacteroidales bacterium]